MGRIYSTNEAAEILGLDKHSVAQMLSRIGCPKFGKSYVIDEAKLEELKSRKGKRGRPPKPKA